MEKIDVKLILTAALLTIILFLGIYSINSFIDGKRELFIAEKMNEIIEDFEEIETTAYLMEFLSEKNNTCDILKQEIEYLESNLWRLDGRIKSYGEITRDFKSDEFYIKEKKRLNRREVIHLSMLEKLKRVCDYNQVVILYFYGKCEDNLKCDEQGFVLTYINQKIDPEIAILSFDADLDIPSVNALIKLYNVTEYPCVVVGDQPYCGLHNKNEMEELLCRHGNLSICINE